MVVPDINTDRNRERAEHLLASLPCISLADMSAIRLMNRTDQKYVTNFSALTDLLMLVRGNYFVQETNGRRVNSYATTYWDDAAHHMFRLHQAGHMPRRKVRVRTYVESGLSFLEIKNKDNHGKTFKNRVPVPSVEAVLGQKAGQDFLEKETGLTFADIEPQVANKFSRITLVNYAKTERLTIDFNLSFFNYSTQERQDMPDAVIIELKRDGRFPSPVLPLLRQLRIKPSGFSKYCIGQTITDSAIHPGLFKKRLIKIKKAVAHPVASAV